MPAVDAPRSRRLATILFADVHGYSRLMRVDEERTLVDLHAHLDELVTPVVERFRGRIVKTVGDGVLAEFASAVEAVRSAAELQRGMAARNAGLPEAQRQTFRIGLHLGDIIVSGDDVFGDAVNVAARLQALAEPGSIVMSSSVFEQVRDKISMSFRDLGSRSVKNIDRPIHVYALQPADLLSAPKAISSPPRRNRAGLLALLAMGALVTVGAAAYGTRYLGVRGDGISSSQAAEAPLSVAVLLFANQSGDPRQTYFADGLTEDITRALGRFGQLTVLSYAAVLPLRGKDLPLPEIGRTLNARYVVTGTVRREGTRLRVTVQLSDTATSAQLWSDQYDDELSDVFAVQDRIARSVAGTLAENLRQIALQGSARRFAGTPDAYDLMLRSRAMAAQSTSDGNRMAGDMLERAMRSAPGDADVHAELADVYLQRAMLGWSDSAGQDVASAVRLARKAVDLDADNVLGHSVLARAYAATRQYELALAEAGRALALNPSDAQVLVARSAVLLRTGQIGEAIAAAEQAIRLNPAIGPEASLNLGIAYLLAGRYDDAAKLLETARSRFPDHALIDFPLAASYAGMGRMKEAAEALARGRRKDPAIDLATFAAPFQDPGLRQRLEASLRKAGMS